MKQLTDLVHERKDGYFREEDRELLLPLVLNRKGAARYLVIDNLSSSTMGSLAFLHQHPEVKQRLAKEVAKYKADNCMRVDEELTLNDLKLLPYLDNIFFETLRFMSATPVIVRNCKTATDLVVADQKDQKKIVFDCARFTDIFFFKTN